MSLSRRCIPGPIAVLALFLSMPSSVASQTDPAVVIPEDLVFLDAPDYSFVAGEPFKLNVDYSSLRERSQRRSLTARIFRGTIDELIRFRGLRTSDGCRVYATSVYRPYDYNGGIDFGFNFDENWLQPDASGQLRAGHFVLVFELAGPSDGFFALREDNVAEYFGRGWSFSIQPPGYLEPTRVAYAVAEMEKATAVTKERLNDIAAGPEEAVRVTTAAEPEEAARVTPGRSSILCHALVRGSTATIQVARLTECRRAESRRPAGDVAAFQVFGR